MGRSEIDGNCHSWTKTSFGKTKESGRSKVSYVSPHSSDWTHPWNTDRFGLLLVLDRCPHHLGLGSQLLSARIQAWDERRILANGRCNGSILFWHYPCSFAPPPLGRPSLPHTRPSAP